MHEPLRVDQALLKRTTSDAIRFTLTRPTMIVMWVLVAISLLAFAIVIVLDPTRAGELGWLCVALATVTVALVALAVLPVRKAVAIGMPVGSSVSASIDDDVLSIKGAQGYSEIRLSALKKAHRVRNTVLVQLKKSPSVSVVPREALTAAELGRLGVY